MKISLIAALLILLLTGIMIPDSQIQQVKAEIETIYIRADGRINPPTVPIQQTEDIYTFTSNISSSIVVEKDNIVIDGAGYALIGDEGATGIMLENRFNVTIKNMKIVYFGCGVSLLGPKCHSNKIIGNQIMYNGLKCYGNGVWLAFEADNNLIQGNNITDNWVGIFAYMSGNTVICDNLIASNRIGVWLCGIQNIVTRNQILNNNVGIYDDIGENIIFDNTLINNTTDLQVSKPSETENNASQQPEEETSPEKTPNEENSEEVDEEPVPDDESPPKQGEPLPTWIAGVVMTIIAVALAIAALVFARKRK